MPEKLLLVFAKNKLFGLVKTRLAKSIGPEAAYKIYEQLFHLTELETQQVSGVDIQVYFSHEIDESAWGEVPKYVQEGKDLGARMSNAFKAGFKAGYTQIIGVGADLPDLTAERIENAFRELDTHDFVFGPAEDGGYYLVGLNGDKGLYVFENKPWSTADLLKLTKAEIETKKHKLVLLEELNDIDTIEDLEKSSLRIDMNLIRKEI